MKLRLQKSLEKSLNKMTHKYIAKLYDNRKIIFEIDSSLIGHEFFGRIKINDPDVNKIKLYSSDFDYLLKKGVTDIVIVPYNLYIEDYENKMSELNEYYHKYDELNDTDEFYEFILYQGKKMINCTSLCKYTPDKYTKQLEKDNEKMRTKIEEQKLEIKDLIEKLYQPGNFGYLKAKESFESLKSL